MWRKNEQGMFQRSLTENPNVALRLNHAGAFARTQAGTLRLTEDDKGLRFEADLSKENSQAVDMAVEMARGTLVEASVAYYVQKDRWEMTEDEDGNITETQFTIEGDLNYGDVSVVLYGANPDASAWLQSRTAAWIQSLAPSPAAAKAVIQALEARYPDTDGPSVRPQVRVVPDTQEEAVHQIAEVAGEVAADPSNGLTPGDRNVLLQLKGISANL